MPYVVLLLALLSFSKDSKIAFKDGRSLFLQRSERVRASLGAVELLGRERVDPKLEVVPGAAPFLEAGHWFDTLDDLRGDPGYSPAQLARAPGDSGSYADDTLVRAGGLALGPATQGDVAVRARLDELDRPRAAERAARAGRSATTPLTIRARRFGENWVIVGVLPVPRRARRRAAPAVRRLAAAVRTCRRRAPRASAPCSLRQEARGRGGARAATRATSLRSA